MGDGCQTRYCCFGGKPNRDQKSWS